MSLAQKIRQEGVEEGIKEGIHKNQIQTAISMLADGADPKFVAKHTKLSLDKINDMIKNKPVNDENQ